MYIHRRIHLEGWDVELQFRAIGARVQKELSALGRSTKIVALLLAVSLSSLASSAAASAWIDPALSLVGAQQLDEPDPQQVIETVLEHPDFSNVQTQRRWKSDLQFGEGGLGGGWLTGLLETPVRLVALAVVLAVVIAALHAVLRSARSSAREARDRVRSKPEELHGLDVRPESLPDDVAGEAWALWQQGDPTAALGLLYRGALAHLIHARDVAIERGDTEGDCLTRVAPLADRALVTAFSELTASWRETAYARRPPSDARVRNHCDEFGDHFGAQR